MKNYITLFVLFFSLFSFAQDETVTRFTASNKGKVFFSWGGNRETYSRSDIRFYGDNYDFTLFDVKAQDKPKGWHVDYVNPGRMTIPQTNFRLGYFFTDKYSVTIGFDHMKYVMVNDRTTNYSGYYPNAGTYGENPTDNSLFLSKDFLQYEHTDGLNYVHTEVARFDDISTLFKLPNTDKFQINVTEGLGGGFLYPKTNSKLLGNDRNDEFKVAGYGLSAKAGLNITLFKYFFIQTEIKAGYINLGYVSTTKFASDKASQDFWFLQNIISFGGIFKI